MYAPSSRRSTQARAGAAVCRHCCFAAVNRPHGLCWSCYYKPGVRAKYDGARARKKAPRGGRKEPTPTSAAPGTEEKLLVLAQRLSSGMSLWHKDDAPLWARPDQGPVW